ncbi:MAG: retroviral-like aspartic protease family protein [Janthinobacterium lividum]
MPGFRMVWVVLLPLFAWGCAGSEDGPGGCVMREVAELPVLNEIGAPIVKAGINGTPVAFIVDSGARVSIIGRTSADALRLPVSFENHHIIIGIGGATFAPDATIGRLSLGEGAARNITFITAGEFGQTFGGLPVVGLFGGDFLANYDVEFDLPAHRIGLYTEQHCGAHFRPWADAFYEQKFDLNNETEIDLDASLDGHTITLQLDSGAQRTVLDLDTGATGGARSTNMADDPKSRLIGVDGNPVFGHTHRFDTLSIGPERFASIRLNVADVPKSLLGADFLRSHRVWVSYRHEMLYIHRVAPGG